MSHSKKKLLIVIRHSPYGSSLAKAALDLGLAAAAFDQTIDLLFLGDGVLQLLAEQDSRVLGVKNIGRQLASLPLYDIDSVYVEARAARSYHLDLDKAPVPAQALDTQQIQRLLDAADHTLGF